MTTPQLSIKAAARNPIVTLAVIVLSCIVGMAVFAPYLSPHDPDRIQTLYRLRPPSAQYPLGTDSFGRDLLSRVLYGAQTSLLIGAGTAALSVALGLAIGLVAGFVRSVDAIVMRVVDGLMSIPNLLLAICIVTLAGANLLTVLVAITLPEIPRVVRLVRSVVLSAREEPYVEAALTVGSSMPRVLWRHLMPNTRAPLIVLGSYIGASAILTEAVLSFIGAGINPATPTWGNIMADGRSYFRIMPELIFWPGLALSLTILSINLIGDALRDALDPRLDRGRAG